jgi:hypothetical protein
LGEEEEEKEAPAVRVYVGRMGDRKAVVVVRAMAARMEEEADDAAVVDRRRVAANVPRNCWRRRRGREHMFL